ncbi:MAG: polyprenol monophosphomannose synthase [Lachnospiraceae bacterium]|nr:polyprenol monophosphomannose synthase [Lachnospiraceae bacterium]
MKVCIVIPTYNERKNILKLIPEINEIFNVNNIDGQILIIDDNSPDGTWDLAKKYEKENYCKLLRRKSKQGLGTAYKQGFMYALKNGYDVIFEMDADYSHDPNYIPQMLSKINEGYDMVVGSRLEDGGKRVEYPLHRTVVSNVANEIIKLFLHIPERDVTTGYRAFRKEVLEKIDVKTLESKGFEFQLETLFKANIKGFKITHIPIIFRQRVYGNSKMSINEVIRFLKLAVKLKFKYEIPLRKGRL